MQFHYIPVEERFNVRVSDELCARMPDGAFSTVSNYPVYALRLVPATDNDGTEFLLPGSDLGFYWVPMSDTRLSRRT